MKKNKHRIRFVGSIEDTSLLRKFTVLFLIMALIPTLVLYYFYIELRDYGNIRITEQDLNLTLIFVVLGVILGYFTMRRLLLNLINLIMTNRKIMEGQLSSSEMEELGQEKNEINVLTEAFKIITKRMEENVHSLELAKKTLHAVLTKIGRGISSMDNIGSFLELIVETVTNAFAGKIGVLALLEEGNEEFIVKTVYGASFKSDDKVRIKVEKGTPIHSVILNKEAKIITEDVSNMIKAKDAQHCFESPLICAPLICKDIVMGLIIVSGRQISEPFDDEEKTLLFNLASQTAVAIENSQLNKDIEQTYLETITALALAVDAKDKYSRGHLERVANYSMLIGKNLGLDEEDLNTLRDAANLHDIGKIGIPDEVLNKAGKLTEQERSLMERHTEIGESIIKPIRSLNHLCDLIRHHHEKLNGKGYPDGLKGDEISPLVRILSIADIYDALTTDRSYRKKFTKDAACEILRSMKDELDPDLVSVFIELLDEAEKST